MDPDMSGQVGGLERLVPHAMMQTASESLYIGEFDLEPLQMSATQIQLPDMDALRLRSHRMSSPPAQLHHLMPASHGGGAGVELGAGQMLQPASTVTTHHTLTTMKYPGTPPDTPPCSSSPSPGAPGPYTMSQSVSTGAATATIGLTDVTELVSWRYNQDQVHALDLRGQCPDLGGRGGVVGDKLGEGAWLSMEYVDTEDPQLRHCTTVISALPPTQLPSPGSSVGGGKLEQHGSSLIDDVQAGEVTMPGLCIAKFSRCPLSVGHPQRAGAQQAAARLPQGGRGQAQAEEADSEEPRLRPELSLQAAHPAAGPGDQQPHAGHHQRPADAGAGEHGAGAGHLQARVGEG